MYPIKKQKQKSQNATAQKPAVLDLRYSGSLHSHCALSLIPTFSRGRGIQTLDKVIVCLLALFMFCGCQSKNITNQATRPSGQVIMNNGKEKTYRDAKKRNGMTNSQAKTLAIALQEFKEIEKATVIIMGKRCLVSLILVSEMDDEALIAFKTQIRDFVLTKDNTLTDVAITTIADQYEDTTDNTVDVQTEQEEQNEQNEIEETVPVEPIPFVPSI